MDVKSTVKWITASILSTLIAFSTLSQAGPIGKSSSASARITLVIPPRPGASTPTVTANNAKTSDKGSKQVKTNQKSENR